MTSARRIAAAAALALLVAAPGAQAARASRDLWATINVCDAASAPNRVGIRARMPGDATRERMYMRFTAQYHASDGSWKAVGGRGRSRWLYAGSALFQNQELGWTFLFDRPRAGSSFEVRGLVDFEWRKRTRAGKVAVVHHARMATRGGHVTSESSPTGFSAAHCTLSAR